MRKEQVNVTFSMTMNLADGEDVESVLHDMGYSFKVSPYNEADILDTEMIDFEIMDSNGPFVLADKIPPKTKGHNKL
jgi:hypothetical protein